MTTQRPVTMDPSNDNDHSFGSQNNNNNNNNIANTIPRERTQLKRDAITDAAPLYITIGPQCCGKSSLLRRLDGGRIKDVTLDDQPDVYVPVPTTCLLDSFKVSTTTQSSSSSSCATLLGRIYHGKSLLERIREGVEAMLILHRWNGDLTPSDFEKQLLGHYRDRHLPTEVAQQLVSSVETFLASASPPALPEEVSVFILESLFRSHPETDQSAIQRGLMELRSTPRHTPVAWGNTNSRPSDYTAALEIACQTRRPVRFVICHPSMGTTGEDGGGMGTGMGTGTSPLVLPWVPLEGLLLRNLHRFATTGRYVPAFAIADCCRRVEQLVPPTLPSRGIIDNEGLLTIERHLVAIASPPSSNDRSRGSHGSGKNGAFEFVLTDQRLIQKRTPQKSDGHY